MIAPNSMGQITAPVMACLIFTNPFLWLKRNSIHNTPDNPAYMQKWANLSIPWNAGTFSDGGWKNEKYAIIRIVVS